MQCEIYMYKDHVKHAMSEIKHAITNIKCENRMNMRHVMSSMKQPM